MPDNEQLMRFFRKRGFKVKSVHDGTQRDGTPRIVITIDEPDKAKEILADTEDDMDMVFVLASKPWYSKLLFWRR